MKNKRITHIVLVLILVLVGTFIFTETIQYMKRVTFTQEKWFSKPDKRFLIVKDMIKKHDFANMTKEQVINLLGPPGDGLLAGGVPIRAYDSNKPVDLLNNQNSVCYFTKTGRMAEEFNGLYLQFDSNGNVIDYAIIYFTT